MSNATSKDFSEGEISSIIMGDTDQVYGFVWSIPEYLELPFLLVCSSYYTFKLIGWYGFIVIIITFASFSMSFVRQSTEKNIMNQMREKKDKRMLHINESFQNIKGIKLYGWEQKFIDKIESIYKEETALKHHSQMRNAVYDFIAGCLSQAMPLLVYGLYAWNGNVLDLGQMVLTNIMMNKFKSKMLHANSLYRNIFRVEEAMTRLNQFYRAPEV